MKKVLLNKTGLNVSRLCLGTMYFGIHVPEKTSHELMDMYADKGGNFLDTANKYSTWVDGFPDPVGEGVVGRWIKSRKARNRVVLATKMGFPYLDVPRGLTRDLIMQEVEKSLKRLQVESIDLLYAHSDDYETPQEETLRAFEDLISQGKVKAIGASNFYAWRLASAAAIAGRYGLHEYSCLQTRLSLVWPDRISGFGRQLPATEENLDYARVSGMNLICYSPLLRGCFGRDDRSLPEGYDTAENRETLEMVRSLGKKYSVSGNAVAIAWMLSAGFIPVVTGSTKEQIEENILAETLSIDESDRNALSERFYPKRQL